MAVRCTTTPQHLACIMNAAQETGDSGLTQTLKHLSRGSSMLGEEPETPQQQLNDAFLPYYIVYHIMTLLRRQDLNKCRSVCKSWQLVTSDECFGWINAFTIHFYKEEYTRRWSAASMLGGGGSGDGLTCPLGEGKIVSFSSVSVETVKKNAYYDLTYNCFHIAKENKILKGFSAFADQTNKIRESNATYTLHAIETFMAHPKLWRTELRDLEPKEGEDLALILTVELNVRVMEKLVETHQPVPMVDEIAYLVAKENEDVAAKFLDSMKHGPSHIPVKTVATQQQPIGLAKSIKLYKYQLDAVNWMKSVEQDVDVGFDYTILIPWRSAKTSVLFDIYKSECVPVNEVHNHISKVKTRGGMLADEMGLGKTLEIISLVIAHPGDPSQLDPCHITANQQAMDQRQKENEAKREANNVTASGRPKRSVVDVVEPIKRDIRNRDDLFRTNATLVLCPAHLVRQWLEEIEKYTRPHLNVIMWNNIRELKASTYQDIINADVVLFSHQMLYNDNYLNLKNTGGGSVNYKLGTTELSYKSRIEWVNAALTSVWSSPSPANDKQPLLEHFHWRRLVIDEAHEFDGFKGDILDFEATYRWYMTGTPFPDQSQKMLDRILQYLRFPQKIDVHKKYNFVDILMNNLYWRNTRESIKNEYEIPPVVEDLVLLDLTSIEQSVYKTTKSTLDLESTGMMLGHIQLAYNNLFSGDSESSLAELRIRMLEHFTDSIKTREQKIAKHEHDIFTLKQGIQKLKEDLKVEVLESKVGQLKWQIRNKELVIATTRESIKQYKDEIKLYQGAHGELIATAPTSYTGPSMTKNAKFLDFEEEQNVVADANSNTVIENKNDGHVGGDAKDIEKEKDGDKTDENDAPELPWSDIIDMTLPKLKEELMKRGIKPNNKQRKADLQKVLKEAVKQKTKTIETKEDEPPSKGKRKQATPSAATAKKLKPNEDVKDANKNADKKLTVQDKINEQNLLKWWVEKHGTKLGNFLFYLKRLWTDNPSAKVIVFSSISGLLNKIASLLYEYNVNYSYAEGTTTNRTREIAAFKKDATVRVALLNIYTNASGTNIIEASHVILMEPFQNRGANSIEAQAIARAHRQGQKRNVTVVRLIVRNTIEYSAYVENYSNPDIQAQSGHPKMQRTNSLTTALITTPSLQSSAKLVNLLEEAKDLN